MPRKMAALQSSFSVDILIRNKSVKWTALKNELLVFLWKSSSSAQNNCWVEWTEWTTLKK